LGNAGKQAGRDIKAGTDEATPGVDDTAAAAERAENNLSRLKSEMLQAGASAESLGLKSSSAADGLEQTAEASSTLAGRWQGLIRNAVGLGSAAQEAAEKAKRTAEVFPDLGEKGEESFKRTDDAARSASDGVKGVGEAAEQAAGKVGNVGGFINSILNSWRELSDSAASAVNRFTEELGRGVNSVQGYFTRLARFTQDLRKQQTRQTEEADRLIQELDRVGDTLGGVSRAQQLLNREVQLLDTSQVEALENAMRAAADEADRARQSSADLVQGLEDDLLRLEGRTEELEKRRLDRQKAEIQAQLQSNALDEEARGNLQRALDLINKKAAIREQQAQQARSEAEGSERIAEAAEREADALERSSRQRRSETNTRTGRIEIDLRTTASENGAPNFSQADLANLANLLLPKILEAIRRELERGL
ncbi:MAG: hypothetical protein ACOC0Q_09970, partial [Wenzhouxiangella sp.]